MDLFAVVDQVIELLRSRGRVSYRALQVQFNLDDAALDALKVELIEVHQIAVDQAGNVYVAGHFTHARHIKAAIDVPRKIVPLIAQSLRATARQ